MSQKDEAREIRFRTIRFSTNMDETQRHNLYANPQITEITQTNEKMEDSEGAAYRHW